MSNFDVEDVLAALPIAAPPRHFRFLVALTTFPADSNGWRSVGTDLLMQVSRLSRPRYKQARDELIEAKLIEYEAGNGRGNFTRWRFLFAQERDNQVSPERGNPRGTPFDAQKGGTPQRPKGVPQNALTSGNANTALKLSALEKNASAAPATQNQRGECSDCHNGYLASTLIDGRCWTCDNKHRAQVSAPAAPAAPTGLYKQPWCGQCSDDKLRQVGDPDNPARCPICHPLRNRPLARVTSDDPAQPQEARWSA